MGNRNTSSDSESGDSREGRKMMKSNKGMRVAALKKNDGKKSRDKRESSSDSDECSRDTKKKGMADKSSRGKQSPKSNIVNPDEVLQKGKKRANSRESGRSDHDNKKKVGAGKSPRRSNVAAEQTAQKGKFAAGDEVRATKRGRSEVKSGATAEKRTRTPKRSKATSSNRMDKKNRSKKDDSSSESDLSESDELDKKRLTSLEKKAQMLTALTKKLEAIRKEESREIRDSIRTLTESASANFKKLWPRTQSAEANLRNHRDSLQKLNANARSGNFYQREGNSSGWQNKWGQNNVWTPPETTSSSAAQQTAATGTSSSAAPEKDDGNSSSHQIVILGKSSAAAAGESETPKGQKVALQSARETEVNELFQQLEGVDETAAQTAETNSQ